ncbi:helix-turn-helix domain-containing protein [Candidatus Margulisiibacteriota bacterium]
MSSKTSKTNWDKLRELSNDEINEKAKSDKDAKPLTKSQLSKFKHVEPINDNDLDIKAIRNKLHVSQAKFAMYFGVSARTIQEWEQHRRKPSGAAKYFLKVIEQEPEAIQRALRKINKQSLDSL